MHARAFKVILALVVVAVGLRLAWPTDSVPATPRSAQATPSAVSPATPSAPSTPARAGRRDDALAASAIVDAAGDVANPLNRSGGTIHEDLRVLHEVFTAWLTTYRSEGNPVGENEEITAALCGRNRLGVAFISSHHQAINERGELCDRWGTPFRFHQLSGTRMEIRSAGADRRFGTPDDALWAPWTQAIEG